MRVHFLCIMTYDIKNVEKIISCFVHKMCDSTCQRLCVALFAVNQFNNSAAVLKVSVLGGWRRNYMADGEGSLTGT